jgi:hypothetical protein
VSLSSANSPYEQTILGRIKVDNRFVRAAVADKATVIGTIDEFYFEIILIFRFDRV